jgi:hypothetical protein
MVMIEMIFDDNDVYVDDQSCDDDDDDQNSK